MVARALLLKPRIIVADEPVSMVDASLRATILGSIDLLNKELGIAVIYITHDLTTAFQISDNIIVMYQGSVVETGRVEDVIQKTATSIHTAPCRVDTTPKPERTLGTRHGIPRNRRRHDQRRLPVRSQDAHTSWPSAQPRCPTYTASATPKPHYATYTATPR